MSRINTNVQSLIAQRVLGQNNVGLNQSLERLSTGVRINRGKDDPAGLIASEALRAEIKSLNSAVGNAERADQVVNIAEGGLQEISSLLTELQGLVTSTANSAGLSASEKEANQLQIDSILQTVDRIAGSASFQGNKLLNGTFDYTAENVASGVENFRINGAKFEGDQLSVDIVVTQSAQRGQLYLSAGGSNLNLGGSGSSFTIEIQGALGSRQLQFASSTSLTEIATAINNFSDVTGVTASAGSTGISLISSAYGSDEFVKVKVVSDGGITGTGVGIYGFESDDANTLNTTALSTFSDTAAANGVRDKGQDIGATVNGVNATADGRQIRINTDVLDVQLSLDEETATALGSVAAFDITGGGADFQLASKVDIAGKVSIGISNVATRNLGDNQIGFLDRLGSGKSFNVVDGNLTDAQKVVDEAIDQISSLRGRLGAFQRNTVGATIRSLGIAVENTAAAQSVIRDADFASETAALTRSQILVSAATNTLALANSQPQAALQLLG
ncbi:MAG: flagellin [Phycisphaerales bacterium]|jgi:flagellin|nr:flagellin [Phycisphaerales bacterium]